ncbi:MAG: DPP IV N-terminal domain-containing protein [Candidatus Electryonea clarkiae]|nr:DPP IV N-terminal domain-containing protein [Candidatus Electryonea clarkiae]
MSPCLISRWNRRATLALLFVLSISFSNAVSQKPEDEETLEVILEAQSTGFYRPTLVFFPADPSINYTEISKTDSGNEIYTTMESDSQTVSELNSAGIEFNDRLRFALEWSGYIRLETGNGDSLVGPPELPDAAGFTTELHGEFLNIDGKLHAKLSLAAPDEEPFYQGTILFEKNIAKAAGDAAAEEILRQLTGMTPPFRSKIVCVSKYKGDIKELILMDYDGGNREMLTRDKSIALSPSWSPDGNRIVFCSFRASEDANIHIADLKAGKITTLVSRRGTDAAPSWSPSGDLIVFAGSHGYSTDLYLIRSDGSKMRNLTLSKHAINTSPSWSPTGRDIVFMSDRSGSPQIYRMDIDGTNILRLTYEGSYNADPAWSAAGEWIVYVRLEKNGFQLRIMDPQGDVDIPLTNEPGDHLEPSWSPDGMRIAYSYQGNLWVMNADGTARRQLFAKGLMPDWSPIPPLTDSGLTESVDLKQNLDQQGSE